MTLGKEADNSDKAQRHRQQFLEVGKVDEIPVGKMKYVEIQGKEIVISNIGGKYYAMDDRCGHI